MDGMDFGEIYEKYYCLVVKIAYDIIGDFYLAQDITQDVYASLYEKIDQIDIDRVKGWLITCASHKAIDYKRKKYYNREVMGDHFFPEPDSISTECVFIRREMWGQVFAELYEKNRQWFFLIMCMDIAGEKPEEVAKVLGITLNNLRVRHHRAKEWVRKRYEKD